MKFLSNRLFAFNRLFVIIASIIFLFAFSQRSVAQEPPPRPLKITVTQDLGFGAFTHGATGGTITINDSGIRSSTGTVIPLTLGYSFSAAAYQLVANPGTLVTLLNVTDVTLSGTFGGSMSLHIVTPAHLVISTDPPDYTLLNIGGTLTVGNTASNPPGTYSGTFDITFIQE
jgi:hypothetical protein